MAHAGQFRRDGVTPYIEHPATVAKLLERYDEITQAVAWLHDVLEDCVVTPEDLEKEIGGYTADCVLTLTPHGEESYMDYIRAIRCCGSDSVPVIVKTADILANLGDNPTPEQTRKYVKALAILLL